MNPTSSCHRVLIVEDDEPTRQRLVEIVNGRAELTLAGAHGAVTAAAAALRAQPPDVALIDLQLPDGSGMELIRQIASEGLATEAMVISVFGDEAHVIAAIEAGATGYLLKDASADDIAHSIVELLQGGSPISPSIARHILKRLRVETPPAPVNTDTHITAREAEVLNLVAKGFSYGEISDLLHMSVHTTTTHVKHIYRKLSVRSRGEAVFEAVQRGLIRLDTKG